MMTEKKQSLEKQNTKTRHFVSQNKIQVRRHEQNRSYTHNLALMQLSDLNTTWGSSRGNVCPSRYKLPVHFFFRQLKNYEDTGGLWSESSSCCSGVNWFQEHLCISSLCCFRSGALSIQVHLLEKGLPELVGADHDGAGWCHFDHPGHETWAKTHNVLTSWTTKTTRVQLSLSVYLQKDLCNQARPRFPSRSARWTRFSSRKLWGTMRCC